MESINKLVSEHHNPDLVDVTASPNGNIQTLLFNDGEIISTKGGHAFLQRSMFSLKTEIYNLKHKYSFPNKLNDYTYAIVKDFDTADLIRNEMEKYNNSI
jgi:hypothetical protein